MTLAKLIDQLKLQPLEPEGGFFRQTFKSTIEVKSGFGHDGQSQPRSAMTVIYYALDAKNFSRLHKLKHHEVYHFYAGSSVRLSLLDERGQQEDVILGNNLSKGEIPQYIVGPNVWQSLSIASPQTGSWALVGTTMCPGFEMEDFTAAEPASLVAQFPLHEQFIRESCRP